MNTKLGRNDRCWCGSGKKYKRCHLDREAQQPLEKQEVLHRFYRTYQEGACLHPNAGTATCAGKTVKAHTIQRNGGLNRIASQGHVYSVLKHGRMFSESRRDPNSKPNRVGIREASTFTGFCALHDNELFAPIEKQPFCRSSKQIALLGYRAICHELYMKDRDLACSDIRRDSDKGKPLGYQQVTQRDNYLRDLGIGKAIKEIDLLKSRYDEVLLEESFDTLGYYVVEFGKAPEVMCSAIHQSTHDFSGNRIHQLGRLGVPADWLTFSLTATDDGGVAVFSWLSDHRKSETVMRTFHEIPDADVPHAIIRFTFEFFENTYFSPEWWDGLKCQVQASLKERQFRDIKGLHGRTDFPRPDECLLDDEIRTVNWPVISRLTSIKDT